MTSVPGQSQDGADPLVARLRRVDRARLLAALFAPEAGRRRLVALYALNHEISRIRSIVSEPMLGEIRLQWWREALAEIAAGAPPRGHEVTEAIAAAFPAGTLDEASLQRLIDARSRDLDDEAPADLGALLDYAEGTGGELAAVAVGALGRADAPAVDAARDIGTAWALVGILRATAHLAGEGRCLLPADLLGGEGLSPGDVLAGRMSPGLGRVAARVAEAARARLAAARTLRPRVGREALPALLYARLADRHLGMLRDHGHDPFRPVEPAPWVAPLAIGWGALSGRY